MGCASVFKNVNIILIPNQVKIWNNMKSIYNIGKNEKEFKIVKTPHVAMTMQMMTDKKVKKGFGKNEIYLNEIG